MLCTFLSASRGTAPLGENAEAILIAVNKQQEGFRPNVLGFIFV